MEETMHCRKDRMLSFAMSLTFCAAAMAAAFAAPAAMAAPKDEKITEAQALDLQKKFETAYTSGDAKTIGMLLADDATFVHGNMRVQSKSEFIDGLAHTPSNIDRPDNKVALISGGAGALVTGPGTVTFAAAPAPSGGVAQPARQLHLYFSTLWVHTSAGWQVLLFQGTEAPPAPPAAAGR
jgi:hypothetical protein